MEELFKEFSLIVAMATEIAAVLAIAYGVFQAFFGLLKYEFSGERRRGTRKEIWLGLGVWLLLGLEFELAADIVRTVISPRWADIGQLAAIALVRTFLNYFLERDLQKYAETGQQTEVDRRAA